MEKNIQVKEPNKKKSYAFVSTFIGIAVFVLALVLLKYLMGLFHVI